MNLNKKIPAITFAIIVFMVGLFFSFLIMRKYNQILEIRYGAPYYFNEKN